MNPSKLLEIKIAIQDLDEKIRHSVKMEKTWRRRWQSYRQLRLQMIKKLLDNIE